MTVKKSKDNYWFYVVVFIVQCLLNGTLVVAIPPLWSRAVSAEKKLEQAEMRLRHYELVQFHGWRWVEGLPGPLPPVEPPE